MNQNRSCPGVPNRYTVRSSRIVIRPKSSATVVVVLRSTPVRLSTGVPAALSSSSVDSGRISLTEPTRVVLPTPKPPAMSTLRATGRTCLSSVSSEAAKAIHDLLEDAAVGQPGPRARVVHVVGGPPAPAAEGGPGHPPPGG